MSDKCLHITTFSMILLLSSLLFGCSEPEDQACDGSPVILKKEQKIYDASSSSWSDCTAKFSNSSGNSYKVKFRDGSPYFAVMEFSNDGVYEGEVAYIDLDAGGKGTVRQGQGTWTHPNGEKYVGEWKDNMAHGQGTWTHPNGEKYVGEWQSNKKHGQGTWTHPDGGKYVGEWQSNKKHGQGTWTHPDGGKYVGEWKDDMSHGQGVETYSDGSEYVGEWQSNKKQGQGTFTYSNGDKYVGEWKDDMSHGQGVETYSNGDKYVGEWQSNKKHGQGTYTFSDGSEYVGGWRNNERHGQGVYTKSNGVKYVGEWSYDRELRVFPTSKAFYSRLERTVGCDSDYSKDKKKDIFNAKYKDHWMKWRGKVVLSEKGSASLNIDGKGTQDLHVEFADGHTGYDLKKGQIINVKFVMKSMGGCFLPFSGKYAELTSSNWDWSR